MKKTDRTINGKFVGAWYEIGDRLVYLAHVTKRHLHGKNQYWLLEDVVLREAQERNALVGVVTKVRGKVTFYITNPEDFYGEGSEKVYKEWMYRGLPGKHFKINPLNRSDFILERAVLKR